MGLSQLANLNHTKDNEIFLRFKDSIEKLRDPQSASKTSVSSRNDNYGSASKRSSESFEKFTEHPRKLSVKKPDLIIDEVSGYQSKPQKSSSDEAPLLLAERKKSSDSSSNIDFKKKKKKKYYRNFQDNK